MISDRERIAILETQVRQFKESQTEIINKLDDLMALKQTGIGAFWLASGLAGLVFMMFGSVITGWFK
jgi:hypothetical protein